jgi:hypothetical protein
VLDVEGGAALIALISRRIFCRAAARDFLADRYANEWRSTRRVASSLSRRSANRGRRKRRRRKQRRGIDVERVSNADENGNRKVSLRPFDVLKRSPIDARFLGELFLGQVVRDAKTLDVRPNVLLEHLDSPFPHEGESAKST